ncbi:D-glucuronyl C5-epimerase family protein [Streptomyces sp. NPDC005279]|uniref:D-glucuronyl C5-epimerase family protein n=1 Tax=Streptomyces sp. NPDC005279 TaxID=3364712 RepID=UPI0036CA00B2
MAGKRRAELGRRRFIRVAGGTVAGAAVAGGGTFTAAAAERFAPAGPDPYMGMPRSLVLSLPEMPGGTEMPVPPLPDQLAEGTLSPPSARTRIPYADEPVNPNAVEDSVPTTLPFEFKTSQFTMASDLPEAMRPWRDRPTTWANVTPDTEHTYLDAQGVIMYRPSRAEAGYNQPVTQCQFGLGCVAGYRAETDAARKALFLERAKAQAQRLIDTRVEARGAWYFPYPFDYKHDTHSGITYTAPWYSGMAQGEAISLFTQLSQLDGLTEEERTLYRAAADGAFASLLRADDATPWAVNKDASGYLWIQEYPINAPGTSDYTYNGMIFATFGLWDYYQATGNPLAEQLYDGSLTTIRDHFPRLRNARWYSYYCDTHRIPAPTYHQHHINLLRQLHWQTGSPTLANRHDILLDDFPPPAVPASAVVAFAEGTHTLYQFDTLGEAKNYGWSAAKDDTQLAAKEVTFTRATQAPVNVRRRIKGRGIYYRINAGAYAGWWVGEYFPKVFLRGEYCTAVYRPHRTATFPAHTEVTCYKFGSDGSVGSSTTVTFANNSNAPFDRRAFVNGRPMVQITAGGLTGYWVPCTDIIVDGQ